MSEPSPAGEGYVIVSDLRKAEEYLLMVGNLGPAMECPRCRYTALSGDLATDFVRRWKATENKD